jgi:protein-disulfide isomerase
MTAFKTIQDTDHITGNKDAPISLIEYGDFQCPHCGRAYPIIKNILQNLEGSLLFVYRHFPLSKAHPEARMAAVAAEAADRQGLFWEMYNMLFENQRQLKNDAIMRYAGMIGLNLAQFESDIQDEALHKKVENDFLDGLKSGVNATPTFFVNGIKYEDSWDGKRLEEYLHSLIVIG